MLELSVMRSELGINWRGGSHVTMALPMKPMLLAAPGRRYEVIKTVGDSSVYSIRGEVFRRNIWSIQKYLVSLIIIIPPKSGLYVRCKDAKSTRHITLDPFIENPC